MTTDPFGTAELRSAVLDAWERSPARFREDANTEEDHAGGYYRDRVVVELAQNAADAAARSCAPGRLLLALVLDGAETRLVAANTGTAIDAAGVASLASLRASAKTADDTPTVGRFGVGFAAVRSVSDDITIASHGGGVCFTLPRAQTALAGRGALTQQAADRASALPILRLPFPAPPHTERATAGRLDLSGYDTVVTLLLRDENAVTAVRDQLDAIDDALLLALPALDLVQIDDGARPRELRDAAARWISITRTGTIPPELLAHRPHEERNRTTWSVTLAFPRSSEVAVTAPVVHAPTPTDEPLSLPALLLATFPLDPSRRHVADGDLAQLVVAEAGRAYGELARVVPEPLDLVPTGLPRGRLDADLCETAVAALRVTPVFGGKLAADTVVIDADVSTALVEALEPTGLGVRHVGRSRLSAARRLGVQVLSLADVIDALPAGLTPSQWRALYGALEPYADDDRSTREALDAILVPCADGTTARGARGLVMPRAGRPPKIEGLRVVHPDAAQPLLLRLGAVPDDDPAVLGVAAVERAVREAADTLTETEIADTEIADTELTGPGADHSHGAEAGVAAILGLVAGVVAGRRVLAGDLPTWLADLPLPSDEGTWQRADELCWPGSWAEQHLDLPVVDPLEISGDVLTADVARALGVRIELGTRTIEHETGQAGDARIAGWADYDDYLCAVLGEGHEVGAISVVTDLDVVEDDSWPAVLELVAAEPELYRSVVGTVRGPGAAAEALSYGAWYLRDVFGAPWTTTDSLAGVLPDRPVELAGVRDDGLSRALGAVTSTDELQRILSAPDPAVWETFLTGLPEVGTSVGMPVALAVWAGLERACEAGLELDLPDVVVALQGLTPRVVPAEDVVVTHEPMWAQIRAVLPARDAESAGRMASALECDVADPGAVSLHGDLDAPARASGDDQHALDEPRAVPAWIAALVPGIPAQWTEHAELAADGREVDWWVSTDGGVHVRAGAPTSALAAACAQAAGRWEDRHLIELALRDDARRAELVAAHVWDRRQS